MKRWGWLGRLLAFTALSVTSTSALAEYRHRVLLLEHESDDDAGREITTRVRGELSAAGFDVVVLPIADEDPQRAVEAAGHELHPASVLLVERLLSNSSGKRREAGAELWLADRMLRKTVVLRLKPEGDAHGGEAARIAVQAVELVKARLAELAVTREREPRTPAPPASVHPLPAVPTTRGAHPNLTLGIGLLEGFQAGQQALTPVLRLGIVLPERWTGEIVAVDVRGGFMGLGGTARIERGPGAATLRHTIVGLDAVMRFLPHRRVQPFVSLGVGVLALDVAGDAPEPYRNASSRRLSGLVDASGGLWLQPLAGLGFVLEGQVMDAWSKTVVRIIGQDAAEVAAPLLLLSGGLMVEF
jgi:hypothetical protein